MGELSVSFNFQHCEYIASNSIQAFHLWNQTNRQSTHPSEFLFKCHKAWFTFTSPSCRGCPWGSVFFFLHNASKVVYFLLGHTGKVKLLFKSNDTFFFHNSMSLSTKHSGHNMAFSQLLKSWQVFGKLLPALLVLLAHKIPPSTPMQSSLFCSSNLAAWPASSSFVSMCPLMCLACLSNCQHHWLTKREILNLQMHFPAWTKYQQFYEAFQLFG